MTYEEFLRRKAQEGARTGFDPLWMPDFLFDFQAFLAEWAIRQGRGAIFAGTGQGKTPMQLVWAENVIRHTNRPVLILAPLAVAPQTVREGQKFGIEAHRSADGVVHSGINITNYERLHYFKPEDFAGVVCDESACLKALDGVRRRAVTEFLRVVPYRLLCSATPAPNDYTELGTSSEALGEMGLMDMLGRFFVNDQRSCDTKGRYRGWGAPRAYEGPGWRFKGHAEGPFWRWVCSWARACRKPSDLGFEDDGFILPPLVEREHVIEARTLAPGTLFPLPARGLREEREERRRTLRERCEKVAELVDHDQPAVVWCHLNPEGDLLEKMIPDARQIKGTTPDDEREEIYEAFATGKQRVLVIKPVLGAWGLNWQHCAHVVTFASHSFEQHFQLVRRCWRFGQKREVIVDIVATEGEAGVRENLRRKSEAAEHMLSELVAHMNDALRVQRGRSFDLPLEVPAWL